MGASVRLYFPVSNPLASGKNGRMPTPKVLAAGISSRSMSRRSNEYSFWAEMNGVRAEVRVSHAASASCHPVKFECPTYRTFPLTTRSSSAAAVSSSGVNGSGSCS